MYCSHSCQICVSLSLNITLQHPCHSRAPLSSFSHLSIPATHRTPLSSFSRLSTPVTLATPERPCPFSAHRLMRCGASAPACRASCRLRAQACTPSGSSSRPPPPASWPCRRWARPPWWSPRDSEKEHRQAVKQLATQHGCRLRHVTAVDNEGLREAAPMLVYVLGRPGAGMGWGKGLGPGEGMGWGKDL